MIQEFVRAFQPPFEVVINTLPAVDQAVDTSVVDRVVGTSVVDRVVDTSVVDRVVDTFVVVDRVVDTFVVADQVVDTVNLQLMEFARRLTTYYLYL